VRVIVVIMVNVYIPNVYSTLSSLVMITHKQSVEVEGGSKVGMVIGIITAVLILGG
jgi:hypothetical protein